MTWHGMAWLMLGYMKYLGRKTSLHYQERYLTGCGERDGIPLFVVGESGLTKLVTTNIRLVGVVITSTI